LINEELILNLVEDTDKILYTFEKDGKFSMSSSIRNELFQEANASLKQVKEALAQPAQEGLLHIDRLDKWLDASIKERAQPAQEPVAHLWECLGRWSAYLAANGEKAEIAPPSWLVDAIKNATTPPQRPWVGLTEDEIKKVIAEVSQIPPIDFTSTTYGRAIEAKLKEKNS